MPKDTKKGIFFQFQSSSGIDSTLYTKCSVNTILVSTGICSLPHRCFYVFFDKILKKYQKSPKMSRDQSHSLHLTQVYNIYTSTIQVEDEVEQSHRNKGAPGGGL